MTALNRKLVRDLLQLRGQMIAIALVIACGIATFVLSICTLQTLNRSREEFYERCRFAQVFAHLKRAPWPLRLRIAAIPGVTQLQCRVISEATIVVPNFAEPASGQLISLPRYGQADLNDLHFLTGRSVQPGKSHEALVGQAFAEAHHLKPGDDLSVVLNGRAQRLQVVGIVLSPEYIFQVRPGEILPDDLHYGILWTSYDELAAATDMIGAFNDVSVRLAPGTNEAQVIAKLDDLTAPYGGRGAYGRSEHPSDRYVSDELRQLRAMGYSGAAIFLFVAAFLLNVVLSRIIQTQREQIAALKAFGYTGIQCAWHYLKLTLLVITGGTLLGIAAGQRLGEGLTANYARFYRFPYFEFRLDAAVVVTAIIVSHVAGMAGVLGSVRRVVRLPPAEAMRPEPPPVYRRSLFERLGLQRWLSMPTRMILRNLQRRPFRAAMSILGIAMAVSTLIVGLFSADLFDFITDFQFFTTQHQDINVTFVEPTNGRVAHNLAHLPGVLACEAFRSAPVRLSFANRSRRIAIMGLTQSRQLWRILDRQGRDVSCPQNGLVLSSKLAEVLGCEPGDVLTVEVLESDQRIRQVKLAGLVNEFSGTTAYMDSGALRGMLDEGDAVSGAMLRVDSKHAQKLYSTLKGCPRVAGVTIKTAALQAFNQTLAENFRKMRFIEVLFAVIITVGVVYNAARISLAERSRELASLRVLGFTRREISRILLGELGVLTIAAMPVGMATGYGLAAWMVKIFSTETLSFPVVIYPRTFGSALIVTAVAATACALYLRRRLDHLDLIAVLKSQE